MVISPDWLFVSRMFLYSAVVVFVEIAIVVFPVRRRRFSEGEVYPGHHRRSVAPIWKLQLVTIESEWNFLLEGIIKNPELSGFLIEGKSETRILREFHLSSVSREMFSGRLPFDEGGTASIFHLRTCHVELRLSFAIPKVNNPETSQRRL